MALRIPSPVALTKPEAYLAYKAGILSRGELKDKLLNPINNYEGWLAKWCELLETYPTNEDGTPQCLTDEEGLLAYLCGVTNRYPATNSRPDDARVSAYIRYLVSARYGRPDHPLNREEFYLSLIKTQFIPSGDPSSDIVIDGTTKAPFLDVKVYGDSYQQTYSGKNLLNINATPTTSHATRSISGQSITVTTESEAATARVTLPISYEADRQMTISFDATCLIYEPTAPNTALVYMRTTGQSDGTTSISLNKTVGTTTHYTGIITPDNDTKSLWLYLKSSNIEGVVSYRFDNIQVEYGASETSYEQYVGGIPAPNPSYPQPISVVTGENVVKVVGKNLWGGLTAFSTSAGGVNFTNNADGSVTASGTATSNTSSIPSTAVAINNNWFVTLPSGNYTASAGTLPSGVLLQIYNANTGAILGNAQGQFTLTEQTQVYVRIRVASGTTIDATFNVQLELGNQATSYQAYTAQDYAISLTGKNLFNKATSTAGYRIDSNGDPYANASYFISDYIKVQPSTTYAYSRGAAGSGLATIAYYKSDKTFISRTMPTIGSSDTSGTVTTPNGAYYARFCDVNEVLDSAQLELGSTATEYEAYSPIELAKIGTYQDRIYKEGEKWYVEKNVGKVVLDGTQGLTLRGTTANNTYTYSMNTSLDYKIENNAPSLSDHFTSLGTVSGINAMMTGNYKDVLGIALYYNSSQPTSSAVYFNSDVQMPTWLASNPTTVYYALATPTTTEITNQTLIDQLNALKQGGAEEGTTYIRVSATDPNLPAKLYVEAPKYD